MTQKTILSDTRELWAEQRGGATFEGDAARVNVKIRNDYDAKIKALVKRMAKDYERQIKKTFNAEIEGKAFDSLSGQIGITLNELKTKWGGIFNKFSNIEAKKFVARLNKNVKLSAHNSLRELTKKTTIKTPDYTEEMQELLRASIKQNVSLIRSISEDYHNQIGGLVLRSITTGGAGAGGIGKAIKANMAMMASIRDYGFKADKRASLIARDQTSKLTSAFNAARMQSAGVEEFKWLHSKGGAEPRELHQKYDGQIFRYDDPPIIDERTGERGLAGVAIGCRCVCVPVIKIGS
jgi:SPP1 gp7 family putative phage head morphogenesis protein